MDIAMFEKPIVMGHRGFPARYPENTMVSFEAAVAAGARFVELDVTLTRDHQVVVIHDDTVDRTTDGSGRVSEFDLKDLRQLDAGSWFDQRFAAERIPTLSQVLERLAGRAYINIEIKSHARADSSLRDRLVQAVVALVKDNGAENRVMVSSFDSKVLAKVKQLHPDMTIAYISEHSDAVESVFHCRELGVFSFHPDLNHLAADLVRALQAEGVHVFPYNIYRIPEIQKAFDLGVDGLITGDPSLVNQLYRSCSG
jgi:glycerophosphoryl diester phosphodiesterase